MIKFLYIQILAILLSIHAPLLSAQSSVWKDSLRYRLDVVATAATEGVSPLWLVSNRHGLSTLHDASGYLRLGVESGRVAIGHSNWLFSGGADLVLPVNHFTESPTTGKQRTSFLVQQLYADVEYKHLRLSLGTKERSMEMKNQRLSSGSQTFGINARPVPQLRLEIPEYWNLVGGETPWLAVKGHFGYGCFTDGSWQGRYVAADERYAKGTLLHTKAGYVRVGNSKVFPLVFEGGLEMATQFGGTIYNPWSRVGRYGDKLEMGTDFLDFVHVIAGMGKDETDGNYINAAGNTVGSWLFSLKYHGKDWTLKAYYDHYFEDHSMMFFQYGWLDGMMGLELTLSKNKWLSSIVYEHLRTTFQGGPVYHDHTAEIRDQISGCDNYYNHNLYPGWQHWGQAIGNPFYTSPLYFNDGQIAFKSNRFTAHHIGIEGRPLRGVDYRILLSYAEHLGTYGLPYVDRKYMTSGLFELSYNFEHVTALRNKGMIASFSFAFDSGEQLGRNRGAMLTLRKRGFLFKK